MWLQELKLTDFYHNSGEKLSNYRTKTLLLHLISSSSRFSAKNPPKLLCEESHNVTTRHIFSDNT